METWRCYLNAEIVDKSQENDVTHIINVAHPVFLTKCDFKFLIHFIVQFCHWEDSQTARIDQFC